MPYGVLHSPCRPLSYFLNRSNWHELLEDGTSHQAVVSASEFINTKITAKLMRQMQVKCRGRPDFALLVAHHVLVANSMICIVVA